MNSTSEVGAWEKHTKGIGLKLLQKFGFKGRLGANENGISSAVEVVVRPTNVGLGFGDRVEAANLPANKKIEAEWKGLEYQEISTISENINTTKSWKKTIYHKEKHKVFSINEFMERDKHNEGKMNTVIDMRHSESGIITEVSNINAVPTMRGEPKLGQELLYNIGIMSTQEETEVVRFSSSVLSEQKKLASWRTEQDHSTQTISSDKIRLTKLELLLTALSNYDYANIVDIVRKFRDIHDRFPVEFNIFGLINMFPGFLTNVVEKISKSWAYDSIHILELFQSVSALAEYFEAEQSQQQSHLATRVRSALSDSIESCLLPDIRRYVANEFQPQHCTIDGKCFKLFQALQLVLSPSVFADTVELVLIPKLKQALGDCRLCLTENTLLPSVWLLPWYSIIGDKSDVLSNSLQQKFASFFSSPTQWMVADTWVVNEISIWKIALGGAFWGKVISQRIAPRLAEHLRSHLTIDPVRQDLSAFNAVKQYEPVLSREQFECLWLGEFFYKWLSTLSHWLGQSGDLSEVLMWYRGWKSLFLPLMLSQQILSTASSKQQQSLSLQSPFLVAVDMLKTSVECRQLENHNHRHFSQSFEPLLNLYGKLTYNSLMQTRSLVAGLVSRLQQLQQPAAGSSGSSSSALGSKETPIVASGLRWDSSSNNMSATFREVVETVAVRNGVTFVPKPGRFVEGKQIWQFGTDSIFIEQNNIFMHDPEVAATATKDKTQQPNAGWVPVALEDLLRKNN